MYWDTTYYMGFHSLTIDLGSGMSPLSCKSIAEQTVSIAANREYPFSADGKARLPDGDASETPDTGSLVLHCFLSLSHSHSNSSPKSKINLLDFRYANSQVFIGEH